MKSDVSHFRITRDTINCFSCCEVDTNDTFVVASCCKKIRNEVKSTDSIVMMGKSCHFSTRPSPNSYCRIQGTSHYNEIKPVKKIAKNWFTQIHQKLNNWKVECVVIWLNERNKPNKLKFGSYWIQVTESRCCLSFKHKIHFQYGVSLFVTNVKCVVRERERERERERDYIEKQPQTMFECICFQIPYSNSSIITTSQQERVCVVNTIHTIAKLIDKTTLPFQSN
jgi:hypothetical protein